MLHPHTHPRGEGAFETLTHPHTALDKLVRGINSHVIEILIDVYSHCKKKKNLRLAHANLKS